MTAAFLPAAAYYHLRLATLRGETALSLHLARAIPVATGVAFAVAMVAFARVVLGDPAIWSELLTALSAFGVVHVPGALIIAVKRVRQRQGAGTEGHEPERWPWGGS